MERVASAKWQGGIHKGVGEISVKSMSLRGVPYSAATRVGQEPGANPEEFVAAAQASCYTMALLALIEKNGYVADSIFTTARVSINYSPEQWSVEAIHIETEAAVQGINRELFLSLAEKARKSCPISKLLDTQITLEAHLVTAEGSYPEAAP